MLIKTGRYIRCSVVVIVVYLEGFECRHWLRRWGRLLWLLFGFGSFFTKSISLENVAGML